MAQMTFITEVITHFLCGACDGWFSISEFKLKEITCPHCGCREYPISNDSVGDI